jgi:uncharacterized membrane protein YdcZ (DUF606 family)
MNRIASIAHPYPVNPWVIVRWPLLAASMAALVIIALARSAGAETATLASAAQAPLWYFFGASIAMAGNAFPFAPTPSLSRRELVLGTLLTFAFVLAGYVVVALVSEFVRLAERGWDIGAGFFVPSWVWQYGPDGVLFLTLAAVILFFFDEVR